MHIILRIKSSGKNRVFSSIGKGYSLRHEYGSGTVNVAAFRLVAIEYGDILVRGKTIVIADVGIRLNLKKLQI